VPECHNLVNAGRESLRLRPTAARRELLTEIAPRSARAPPYAARPTHFGAVPESSGRVFMSTGIVSMTFTPER